MGARLETGLATLGLGLGRWLGTPHPYPHPLLISRGLCCPCRAPCVLQPGEFQGHQLMWNRSARHFSAWKPSRIYRVGHKSGNCMMLGLAGVTL